jgi:hypothetical protein
MNFSFRSEREATKASSAGFQPKSLTFLASRASLSFGCRWQALDSMG